MNLDVPTLMIAGALVAAMSGSSLLVVRYQYRDTSPVVWWAAANFVLAFGMLMLARDGTEMTFASSPFTLFAVNPVLIWIGARRFDGRPAPLAVALLGAALPALLEALGILSLDTASGFRALHIVHTAVGIGFYLAAAGSLALNRSDALRARWPLVVLCTLHAMALSLTVTDRFAGPPGMMGA